MGNILMVSDFKAPGGYHSLAETIATGLVDRGHKLTMLGMGYDPGREHFYNFSLNPTTSEFVPQQIIKLFPIVKPDWMLFLSDIPKQLAIMDNLEKHKPGLLTSVYTASLFPVESNPFYYKWADRLRKNTKVRFTFSEFGRAACEEAGLRVHRVPFALDRFWYEKDSEPSPYNLRYVLTVAANQQRKNLPSGLKIMSEVIKRKREQGEEVVYVIVTDTDSKDGWDLEDAALKAGFVDQDVLVLLHRDNVSNQAIRSLYSNAAALLLPSISEGIGIPLYEAQAQGCPVVATNCCAIPEALADPTGLIKIDHVTPHVWGNTTHYWPSIEDGVEKVLNALTLVERKYVKFINQEEMALKIDGVLIEYARISEVVDSVQRQAEKPASHQHGLQEAVS
jgi:glycosyltransferase involved in cell wall biosynthesis